MAIDFKSNINLGGLQLQNAALHPTGTAPANPKEGQVYWSTADRKLYVYDETGTAWIDVSGDIRQVDGSATIHVTGGSGGTATIALSHLGIEDLLPPEKLGTGFDAVLFWDESNSATKWLSIADASGININNQTLELANIPNASLTNSAVTITKGNGLTSTSGGAVSLGGSTTITVGQGVGIAVEANAVALKNHANLTDNTLTKWDDANGQVTDSSILDDGSLVTVDANLTVTGNLAVQGTLTSLETTNTAIKDNVIVLNDGETGAGVSSGTSGIEIDRGTEGNKTLVWNESTDLWEIGGSVKMETVPTASGVGSVYVQGVNVADAGVIKKMPLTDFRAEMGVSNMTLLLEPSSGVQAVGAVWVTKSGNTYTVEHQMGTKFLIAQVYDSTNHATTFVEVKRNADNSVQVVFADTVTDGDFYLTLQATAFQSHGDGGDIQDGGGGQL